MILVRTGHSCLRVGRHRCIFLALVILGPKEPRKQMNIYLHPLMEKLNELWQGIDAYYSHLKCQGNLCAANLCSIYYSLAYGKFTD
jgi:hypothetical protein